MMYLDSRFLNALKNLNFRVNHSSKNSILIFYYCGTHVVVLNRAMIAKFYKYSSPSMNLIDR